LAAVVFSSDEALAVFAGATSRVLALVSALGGVSVGARAAVVEGAGAGATGSGGGVGMGRAATVGGGGVGMATGGGGTGAAAGAAIGAGAGAGGVFAGVRSMNAATPPAIATRSPMRTGALLERLIGSSISSKSSATACAASG
jgi:hypothetical protein